MGKPIGKWWFNGIYCDFTRPGERLHFAKDPPCFMGKSTISTGPFSIAFCMFTRPGNHHKWIFLWDMNGIWVGISWETLIIWINHCILWQFDCLLWEIDHWVRWFSSYVIEGTDNDWLWQVWIVIGIICMYKNVRLRSFGTCIAMNNWIAS